MTKKSMIAREKKRLYLVNKYASRRKNLKNVIKKTTNFEQKYLLYSCLANLPRNSSATRLHNRCNLSGRPRGYYGDFGLSRIKLRELVHQGLLPGVTKASW
uniref:Small ribosomal subunit protein uS14c n=1 Tax=Trentepohlia odorata TaxID=2576626 RepID=A0A4Y5P3G9_9CHLO|nr:ribosomal protein S14 [Trentepohlia odorata]QCW57807.1 ribosomal protein S14 [Trentepohlia odorata]